MRLDLYQAETAQIARQYAALLDDARQQMATSGALSPLESQYLYRPTMHLLCSYN